MITRAFLFVVVALYTAFAAGPFLWVATLSLRTTTEISLDHYAWPEICTGRSFRMPGSTRTTSVYFENSALVVVSAVFVLTLIGSMAAHCFARYRFRINRLLYFVIFSAIIFPPQITIIAMFQILVDYGLYNSLIGLTLVYIAVQLPLTVYILESFFARIPADLFDAARIDGYPEWQIFWKVSLPIALPAIATTVILNFDPAVERVSVCGGADHRRSEAHAAAGNPALHGRSTGRRRNDRDRSDDRDHSRSW